jgi:hypothetical protein
MGVKEHIIAVIVDVDYTLTPGYMQRPLFDHYEHDADEFWAESRDEHNYLIGALSSESHFPKELRAPAGQLGAGACYEVTYADMILEHVKHGCPKTGKKWTGLNRELLRKLGARLVFFEGLPEAIKEEKEFVKNHNQRS